MEKILLHSNVILNVLYSKHPLAEDAAKVLSLCESRKIEGYITNFTIANIFQELRKTADFTKISEHFSLMLTFLDVQEVARKEVVEAMHSEFEDLENAILSVAAENSYHISAIITENTEEFKNNRVKVLSPKDYLNP